MERPTHIVPGATITTNELCFCPICDKPIYERDPMADHHVYKFGELEYIELAHLACGERANETEPGYWRCD